jgi:hypothetical protein
VHWVEWVRYVLYEHFVLLTVYRTTCGLTPQPVLPLSVARLTAAGVQNTLRSSGQGLTGVQDQESGVRTQFTQSQLQRIMGIKCSEPATDKEPGHSSLSLN